MPKTAIVTGCHGAIGRAISAELDRAVFYVIGADKGDRRRDHKSSYVNGGWPT
jgi:NAD(P)-dependent dehydrogenase (short-subunit alcohol dehydrogenase family)